MGNDSKKLYFFMLYEMDEDDEWTDDWYFSINFSALSQISWLLGCLMDYFWWFCENLRWFNVW